MNNTEIEMFKQELFKELNILDNPKREVFWDVIWDYGGGVSLSEVRYYAYEFIKLIE